MRFISAAPGERLAIERPDLQPAAFHVFDQDSVEALDTALATGRPLLVRGEPGTGKSQLARAAAQDLGRAFLSIVVDARTEARDLLWTFDAVARLAEAQVQGALQRTDEKGLRQALAVERFLKPGPLWWSLNWRSAKKQAGRSKTAEPPKPSGWSEADGTVFLIDEIDKGDTSVPNGLLESLGHGQFEAPDGQVVTLGTARAPLVVVTTNEERALPDAFLRRCFVLHLSWQEDRAGFIDQLVVRGQAHFPDLPEETLKRAASLLYVDRRKLRTAGLSAPGGAEYLDLLLALHQRFPDDPKRQESWLERIAKFALEKHPQEAH